MKKCPNISTDNTEGIILYITIGKYCTSIYRPLYHTFRSLCFSTNKTQNLFLDKDLQTVGTQSPQIQVKYKKAKLSKKENTKLYGLTY